MTGREHAAARGARLAFTRASRDVQECLDEMRAAQRVSLAYPDDKDLRRTWQAAKHRYEAAAMAMARARRLHHEAEAAGRIACEPFGEIDDVA
jgi:hypothetical protein